MVAVVRPTLGVAVVEANAAAKVGVLVVVFVVLTPKPVKPPAAGVALEEVAAVDAAAVVVAGG